jgi:hypothetical protein
LLKIHRRKATVQFIIYLPLQKIIPRDLFLIFKSLQFMQPRKNSKQNASNPKKSFSSNKGEASAKPKSDFKKSSFSKDKLSSSDRPFSDRKPKFIKGARPIVGKRSLNLLNERICG